MKVLEIGEMPNGTNVQIEDWHKDYEGSAESSVIGAYPVSKVTLEGLCAPVRNKTFRLALHFDNAEQAKEAFQKLVNGAAELIDYGKYVNSKKLLECL